MMENDNARARQTFSKRLCLAMDKRKITSTELSVLTGIGKSDISNYRNGKYMPKQDRIYAIAKVLGVRPAWLLGMSPEVNLFDGLEGSSTPVYSATANPGASSAPDWNPEDMAWAEQEDENTVLLNRWAHKTTGANRQQLLDIIRVMFRQDFDEEGNLK